MKGMGTNDDKLVNVTKKMNFAQRMAVRDIWVNFVARKQNKSASKIDSLLKWVKDELSGNYKTLMTALYQSPAAYCAHLMQRNENY